METVTVCRAGPEHTPDIQRLLAIQLREHHVSIAPAELAAAIDGVLRNPARGFFLVAVQGGGCVGVAYVSFIWALEHGGLAGWLEELYVLPAHRDGGVGTLLLNAVIATARSEGCAALDLEIDSGHDRVKSLYQRHGFEALPRSRVVKKLGKVRGEA